MLRRADRPGDSWPPEAAENVLERGPSRAQKFPWAPSPGQGEGRRRSYRTELQMATCWDPEGPGQVDAVTLTSGLRGLALPRYGDHFLRPATPGKNRGTVTRVTIQPVAAQEIKDDEGHLGGV